MAWQGTAIAAMSSGRQDGLPSKRDHGGALLFAIIGEWPVEAELDPQQLAHIAANVRQQPGFVRGYWAQEPDNVALAHAVVILEDEANAKTMAEGVKAAIPSASLRIMRVLAEA